MTRVVSLVASLLVVLAVLADPSSAAERCQEHEIPTNREPPSRLGENPSNFDLVDAVAALMRDKLGLPLPAWRKAYVCPNEAAFSESILRNFGVKAWDQSVTTAAGLATPVGIFLRGDYLARRDLAGRVAIIAHELGHLSQRELAGPRVHDAPRWIVEGHAEWVAFRVLDRLGYGAFDVRRAEVGFSLARWAIPATLLPGLDALDSREQWQRSTLSLSHAATYGQAFLAVDRLTERYGSAKVVEFLSSLRWDSVFPISYGQFVDDFRVHVRSLGPGDDLQHTLSEG